MASGQASRTEPSVSLASRLSPGDTVGKKWESGTDCGDYDELGDPVQQQDWNGTQISEKTDHFSQTFVAN